MNVMLDNIHKSQLVENEETYFDLLNNYLFKSKYEDIYGHVGLSKHKPYAFGLEPLEIEHAGGKALILPNVEYLHNTSDLHKDIKLSQLPQPEYYIAKVRLQAYNGLFRVIKIMKESTFSTHFAKILEHVWCLINQAKDEIEVLGGHNINKGDGDKSQIDSSI